MTAVADNAQANEVRVAGRVGDVLAESLSDVDVLLAGDVFYSAPMAERVNGFLRRTARAGVRGSGG